MRHFFSFVKIKCSYVISDKRIRSPPCSDLISIKIRSEEIFNAERRFWDHYSSDQGKLYTQRKEETMNLLNSEQLLDHIENKQLWEILRNTDPKTMQIILMKIWGFTIKEISEYLHLPEKTIYTRMSRLKSKIQKRCVVIKKS